MASSKHEEGLKNLKQLCKPETRIKIHEAMKTRKKCSILLYEYPATRTNFFVAGYAVRRNLLIQVESTSS